MARQLNTSCNFNTRYLIYLICDKPDNMMEVVVKIKTMFEKHTLVEDRERRTVKYRPQEKCNQPCFRMETTQTVVPLRFRKVRKEAPVSGSSSDSGIWINMGEGFWYPLTISTNPNYPRPVKREEKESNLRFLLKLTPRTM